MSEAKNDIKEKRVLLEDYYQKLYANDFKQTHLIKDTKKVIARLLTRVKGDSLYGSK